jgi:hypothetical protein
MLGEAEVFKGDQFVRRGPGRSGSIRMCWRGRARADQDGNRGSTLCCARLAMEGATVRGNRRPAVAIASRNARVARRRID